METELQMLEEDLKLEIHHDALKTRLETNTKLENPWPRWNKRILVLKSTASTTDWLPKWINAYRKLRYPNGWPKERPPWSKICKTIDFVFPADQRIKLKECEKKDKYLDLARELKKTVEHESNNCANCNWCVRHNN